MRLAYLVLAHHMPGQFGRLTERLDHAGSQIIAHVDASAEIEQFQRAVQDVGTRVEFVDERQRGRWGGFSLVEAEMACLRTALNNGDPDYCILLSGADYPIRPVDELRRELGSGAIYMESWPMPDVRHHKPMSRLRHYYLPPEKRDNRLARVINGVVLPTFTWRNVHRGLAGLAPHGGSQWWAMPGDLVRAIVAFCDENPSVVRFFRHSKAPDEMFFQTLMEHLREHRELRDPLTFADWTRPEFRGASPATLRSEDVELLQNSGCYFARKFDTRVDGAVLDLVDDRLLTTRKGA